MSVPDWPNSYGYNMFLFPPSRWVGGIFYEHTHRLIASGVGLMTTILAVWLWLKDPRKWMHWVGTAAFLLVVAQGVLGGLRVVLADAQLGIFHAILGQLFFILTSAIALFTSRFWKRLENIQHLTSNIQHPMTGYRPNVEKMDVGCSMLDVRCLFLRRLVLSTTILIFCQLIIGATMRQQHAGLAIPDFPLAYGKIWPDTSAAAVRSYNDASHERDRGKSHHGVSDHFANGASPGRAGDFHFDRDLCLAGVEATRQKRSAGKTRAVLAGTDSGASPSRRGDDLVEQGRRRGDRPRAGRRTFARDRRALVHYCFSPFGGIA